ncbi:tRNA lysidine(34) synthetase TilS [Blastopirellula sp. JC732]|uniref:tRNA(Ile)-lysidine synthase n=1 Tax=Blastopirellula sediminis TaxID=2894196 RepID=A0A9X1SIR5_9BACT|nr:tRNA lysidine(34) synthetase TilS [Blastopirellula sediminis]MCC9604798.1 tRNA lysidine(34) synthetase TilS [Blastopirellula sediminis]MCC9631903.1 tRNA lysidine(34) synthetase TilS [Blastopirellula sediminis]
MRPFESALCDSWSPADWADCTVLVAVSGGADSVALLRALMAIRKQGKGRLIVAHIDHNLRVESAEDAEFVQELADRLAIPALFGKVEFEFTLTESGDGIEAAAREARYKFLKQFAMEQGARYIVTAHTADDQVETVLQRILRGTSVAGLTGIPRARELAPGISLLRPMLGIRRAEVEAYLAEIGQDFRHDATNDESDFFRNKLRNELLPLLRSEYLPQVDQSLLRLAAGATECREYVAAEAERLLDACLLTQSSKQVTLNAKRLATADPFLAIEACVLLWRRQDWSRQEMGRDKWRALLTLIAADAPAPIELPGGIRAEKKGEQLTLTPPS